MKPEGVKVNGGARNGEMSGEPAPSPGSARSARVTSQWNGKNLHPNPAEAWPGAENLPLISPLGGMALGTLNPLPLSRDANLFKKALIALRSHRPFMRKNTTECGYRGMKPLLTAT